MQKYSEISRTVNEDPEIAALRAAMQEAQTAYREAFEAAFAKEDPDILEKYQEMHEAMRSRVGIPGREIVRRRVGGGYDDLSNKERQQLDAARRQVMESADVVEARQKRNKATTEEERRTAVEEYRQALHKAMIEADEEVEALLEKLGNQPPMDTDERR